MKYSKLKNDLEDFANQINDYTVTDYKERRDEIHNAINQADTLKNQIEFQCNELENNNSLSSFIIENSCSLNPSSNEN